MNMRILRMAAAIVALALTGVAGAQNLPNYYPAEGFQRVGVVDSLQIEAQTLIIDDLSYTISSSVVIHSPRSYRVPISNLKVGTLVGFKTTRSGGRVIFEIWLLPSDYENGSRRRR